MENYDYEQELVLSHCKLELDTAEDGWVWIYGEDDEMIEIHLSEIEKVVNYLQPILKIYKRKMQNEKNSNS